MLRSPMVQTRRSYLSFPPVNLSYPQSNQILEGKLLRSGRDPYQSWNRILNSYAHGFADEHNDATVLIFSAWNLFSAVLDDPLVYGFDSEDSEKVGGGVWVDGLHATTKMHKLLAGELKAFLCGLDEKREDNARVEVVFGGDPDGGAERPVHLHRT